MDVLHKTHCNMAISAQTKAKQTPLHAHVLVLTYVQEKETHS